MLVFFLSFVRGNGFQKQKLLQCLPFRFYSIVNSQSTVIQKRERKIQKLIKALITIKWFISFHFLVKEFSEKTSNTEMNLHNFKFTQTHKKNVDNFRINERKENEVMIKKFSGMIKVTLLLLIVSLCFYVVMYKNDGGVM